MPELTRRDFVKTAGLLPLTSVAFGQKERKAREMILYVGTYTRDGKSEGIYVYRLNMTTGELTRTGVVKNVVNPSYLAIAPSRRALYAVNEVTDFGGAPSGAVSAFAIERPSGDLRFLNQESSRGGAPCYVTVEKTGRFVLVANYVGGNVTVLPVRAGGALGPATDVAQHEGSGPDAGRQKEPHAHCVLLDRANRHAFAADLGIDKVMISRFDARTGKLTPHGSAPSAPLAPGAGPRHFAFHPDNRHAYVINELNSTITAFDYDAARGTLAEIQTVPSLPPDFSGTNSCADLHVAPSGRFLYGSNRGHDSIVIYAVERGTGRLNYVGHEPTQGKTPRNFTLDPTGTFLLAANQNSDSIVVFRLDPARGTLTATGHRAEVPVPVCLKLIPSF